MNFIKTGMEDVWLLQPNIHKDNRGFFLESYSEEKLKRIECDIKFKQDNHSKSIEKGVVRGLHFQNPPNTQTKLVRVTRGSVYDVIVDLRTESKTFGHWQGFELTEQNFMMLLIPQGFAHGFCTLEDNTEFVYKCDNYYVPESEVCLKWDDWDLGIEWPKGNHIVSDKDNDGIKFCDFVSPF